LCVFNFPSLGCHRQIDIMSTDALCPRQAFNYEDDYTRAKGRTLHRFVDRPAQAPWIVSYLSPIEHEIQPHGFYDDAKARAWLRGET
jgi:hypothetical protein